MREQKNYFGVAVLGALMTGLILGLLHLSINVAMAQSGVAVPDVNALEKLGELVLNWSTMSDLSKGVLFVLILVQVLKQSVDFPYKRLAVVFLSILYGAGQLILGGESALSATMAVLVSGGGAIALYEALKPILKKIPFLQKLKLGKE